MKYFNRTTIAAALAAVLTACGGGTASDVAGSAVNISIAAPVGVLEAGQIITVTGTASSNSSKLTAMSWDVTNIGPAGSAATVTNSACGTVSKTDSSFATGSSVWKCTLTLTSPKTLAGVATYNLSLSASTVNGFGKSGVASFSINPATTKPNPIQVAFTPLSNVSHAGETIRVTGTVQSTEALLTSAKWSVISGGSNLTGNVTPTLQNADCADHVETVNQSALASSLWTCTLNMVVPPRLTAATTYKLALQGTNADGFAQSNTIDVPVVVAVQTPSKVTVVMKPAPTGVVAGNNVTIQGTITSVGSTLDPTKAAFVVTNINPTSAITGPQDYNAELLSNTRCVTVANTAGAPNSQFSCSSVFKPRANFKETLTYTVALSGVDDEGYSNFASVDTVVAPSVQAPNKVKVVMAAAPAGVKAGDNITVQGTITSTDSVLDPKKAVFVLSNITPTSALTGPQDYYKDVLANTVCSSISNTDANTTSTLQCSTVFKAPVTLATTLTYTLDLTGVDTVGNSNFSSVSFPVLAGDPFGLRGGVTANPSPTLSGNTVTMTCTGQGSSNYNYLWTVTNANGLNVMLNPNGQSTTTGVVSFVAPTVLANTDVVFNCAINNGSTTVNVPQTVTIKP